MTAVPKLVQLYELSSYDMANVNSVGVMSHLTQVILSVLVAIVLWKFPLSLSKHLLAPELDEKVVEISPYNFLCVTLIGLGVYLTYRAITDAFAWFLYYQYVGVGEYGAPVMINFEVKIDMWTTLVEFILSVILIFKSKTIANQLMKVSG